MKLKIILLLLSSLFFTEVVKAQENSMYTLSESELLNIVKKYHIFIRKANNEIEQADANILKARGAFDPTIESGTQKKELGNQVYYNYQQAGLKIPTWYGIEFNAGFENIAGLNTNPERTLKNSSYAGVSFSLLKNILIDKRRADLQQSKLMKDMSEIDKKIIINNVLYDAASQYWNWVQAYNELIIINDAITNIESRLDYTTKVVRIGERAAIDTIEAATQLQFFQGLQSEKQLEVQNALIKLSMYTWAENQQPYDLPYTLVPSTNSFFAKEISFNNLIQEELINFAKNNHPELQAFQPKQASLLLDKKLKFQELLPDVKVKYNQLGKNYQLDKTIAQPLLENNYQYGISFAMPLRLSQGRSNYTIAKLKINNLTLDLQYKMLAIENKIREQYNQLNTLQQQISIYSKYYNNQLTLQKGEETKFQNGESSLFLINSRELKTIEASQKLTATIAKYYKQQTAIKWATGELCQ